MSYVSSDQICVSYFRLVYGQKLDAALVRISYKGFLESYVIHTCVSFLSDCGTLPAPENGFVDFKGGTTYQATAFFNCSNGYYLSHSDNRTCGQTGQWNSTQPVCVKDGKPLRRVYNK